MSQKILIVITQSNWGGAQFFVLTLAKHLHKNGKHVVVAAGESPDGELFTKLNKNDIDCRYIPSLRRTMSPWHDMAAIRALRRLYRDVQPNTIILNSTKAGILGSIAAKGLSSNIIYRIGGWVFNEPLPWWKKKLGMFLEHTTAQFKDYIVVVSERDKTIANNHKIHPRKKLLCIYNGINPTSLNCLSKNEARDELGVTQDEIVVGCIANLYPTKGIEMLIRAAAHIDVRFVVIGEGQERKRLSKLINSLGVKDRFELLGQREYAHRYLKAFDIFALPSHKEGFPWVVLEAMCAQIPIIATRVGALPEILNHNESGLLVSPNDPDELARALEELINSEEKRTILASKALSIVAKFDESSMLRHYDEII